MSEPAHTTPAAEGGPVTVSVSRRVNPGREDDYEAWVHGIAAAASEFPGHQGINVLRPSAQTGGRYVLIYRFDSDAHAAAWEASDQRAHWIEKLEGITGDEDERKRVTGLEVWFDLPDVPAAAHAPRYKMALVLIMVVFGLVFPLQVYLGPAMAGFPAWLRSLVIVIIQVLLMTYLVMPRVTALLKPWLFSSR
ncbi:antibiotic biosynthesis monooxygenase [Sinisalibacter aestuarii]|uniref:Antibiotic biosynthesis monooxygenase n=1 Tax=Sinisalibacter aestuarii TaxID=2949426 RepID=A0ABQ5LYU9_9RHOB|nr:antibiotic biosynthesis monooxygenase [Sinisalibacter aestuarii]GKY90152.1 antibiotic biosynthesis monooxygenase [Sinisalibacter aestuarii]